MDGYWGLDRIFELHQEMIEKLIFKKADSYGFIWQIVLVVRRDFTVSYKTRSKKT